MNATKRTTSKTLISLSTLISPEISNSLIDIEKLKNETEEECEIGIDEEEEILMTSHSSEQAKI